MHFWHLASAILAGAALTTGAHAQQTSNFSSVGFDLDVVNSEAFTQSVLAITETCEIIPVGNGNMICLEERKEGGQIWLGLRTINGQLQYVTANPAFAGKSQFPVTVNARHSEPDWEPFEYRLSATFSELDIPLVFELADPRSALRFADMAESRQVVLDLTAFTFSPQIYEDDTAFAKAQANANNSIIYEPDFFIPAGHFGDEPNARALFAGKVLEAEHTTTEQGATYWRTLVTVKGGATINVVFDDVSTDIAPKIGNLIVGDFWLSAHILSRD